MTRTTYLAGALSIAQALFCASAFAQASPAVSSGTGGPDFVPYPRDGVSTPIPNTCGGITTAKDSLLRDLGKGITLVVIPSYGGGDTIAANLIFQYHELKESLTVLPEKFELQVRPSGKVFVPKKVVRHSVQIEGHDIFQEEVYVEFMVPENVESLSFAFPPYTVSTTQGDSSVLVVRSFSFNLMDRSARSRAIKARSGCMYAPINLSRLFHGR